MAERDPRMGLMAVDDNQLLGEALERWLGNSPKVRWLGWTPEVAGAAELIAERRPRIVLLDVDIPGSDTLAFLKRVVAEFEEVSVVMLSGHVRRDYIEQYLDAGASGFIIKDERVPDIVTMLERVAAGEVVLSPTAQSAVAGGLV